MKSVCDNENTIIIKNSKFITYIYNVSSLDMVTCKLNILRDKYRDATHIVYAYIIDNIKKSSDDGEPGGTAGAPILQVMDMNNLNNVLCVVVRYFGGIKLGAGGLVRAYSKCCRECLNNHIIELKDGFNISVKFKYDLIKQIDYVLRDSIIVSKEFNDYVVYSINCDIDTINVLKQYDIDITINDKVYY